MYTIMEFGYCIKYPNKTAAKLVDVKMNFYFFRLLFIQKNNRTRCKTIIQPKQNNYSNKQNENKRISEVNSVRFLFLHRFL